VYTFIVAPEANKPEVKNAVEKAFNVKVAVVRTVNAKGKSKRMKNMLLEGRRKDWKKAYVTLKEGFRLDII
jgi:large subunit ribosomal protein L23